ncbi:Hypothetical protein AA314_02350 [Archangium gephyra]|uniref:Uncharacterized protein n=1 Tax=Archangium gephyra TaxID=48 RepID=A0AAC8Q404_9BACT|nr:Hypothetical protein AA314_02350 [Archangium gephyra]
MNLSFSGSPRGVHQLGSRVRGKGDMEAIGEGSPEGPQEEEASWMG